MSQNDDFTGAYQPPPPKRHRLRNIITAVLAVFGLLVVAVVVAGAVSTPAPHPAAAAAPVTSSAPAKPVATKSTAARPAGPVTVGRFAGTGDWNSPPLGLNGNPVTVTYVYSGNILPGEQTGDNFMADLTSSGDDQQIANAIGTAGGTTTTLYPDTTMGGSSYHLSVQATGAWSFVIKEAP